MSQVIRPVSATPETAITAAMMIAGLVSTGLPLGAAVGCVVVKDAVEVMVTVGGATGSPLTVTGLFGL